MRWSGRAGALPALAAGIQQEADAAGKVPLGRPTGGFTAVQRVQQQEALHAPARVLRREDARPARLAGHHAPKVGVPHQQPQLAVVHRLARLPLPRHVQQLGAPRGGELGGAQLQHLRAGQQRPGRRA
jgi:hypothetical protein